MIDEGFCHQLPQCNQCVMITKVFDIDLHKCVHLLVVLPSISNHRRTFCTAYHCCKCMDIYSKVFLFGCTLSTSLKYNLCCFLVWSYSVIRIIFLESLFCNPRNGLNQFIIISTFFGFFAFSVFFLVFKKVFHALSFVESRCNNQSSTSCPSSIRPSNASSSRHACIIQSYNFEETLVIFKFY